MIGISFDSESITQYRVELDEMFIWFVVDMIKYWIIRARNANLNNFGT